MKVMSRREFILVALLLLAVAIYYAPMIAYAVEIVPVVSQGMPEWFWPACLSGVIQGAVVFGGVKVKLDWIFQRIEALETAEKETNARIDRALVRVPKGRASD